MTAKQYREARESAGLSVAQMAKALGVTRNSIYRRESLGASISEEMEIAQRQVLKRVRAGFIAGLPQLKQDKKAASNRLKRAVKAPIIAESVTPSEPNTQDQTADE